MKRKITDKTIQYTMRIVGSMILISAVALIVYLVWVTSKIGIDASLFLYFGVGIISAIVAAVMIYFSFKISFEEERAVETEVVHRKEEPHMLSKKCG